MLVDPRPATQASDDGTWTFGPGRIRGLRSRPRMMGPGPKVQVGSETYLDRSLSSLAGLGWFHSPPSVARDGLAGFAGSCVLACS